MNTLTLQKQADKVERLTQNARRALLEFEVMKSKWEIAHGLGKVYSSVGSLMRDITKKAK